MSQRVSIPPFRQDGCLPSGDYPLTLKDLRRSSLVQASPGAPPTWDSAWRAQLVDNLAVLAGQLWQIGIEEIYINGSFVEDKDHPNDIDGYFECDLADFASGRIQRELNRLDPKKVWTWDPASRRSYRGYEKRQLPMWHEYRVELYPHYRQLCGIRDEHGNELEFPAAFRLSRRENQPKGIVKLVKEGTP